MKQLQQHHYEQLQQYHYATANYLIFVRREILVIAG